MNDIAKRLRIKASVISMGEKIAWGSDTDLMNEAADIIESLETAIKKVSDYNLRLETQIQEMKNCQNCTYEKGEWYKGGYVFGEICAECLDSNNLCNWQLKRSE